MQVDFPSLLSQRPSNLTESITLHVTYTIKPAHARKQTSLSSGIS
jgi:hypothetical protein